MATLKGQNLRVILNPDEDYECVGMSTSCTINLTANTDDASTKDDTGMASKPTVNSRTGQVSVESLSVADVAAILTAIKSQTPFLLVWDETEAGTNKNQDPEGAAFARQATAILNDVTFAFNDRENATKSLQFTLISAPTAASAISTQATPAASYTKGQFVRLFLGSDNTAVPSKVIAAAKTLQVHVSVQLENSTSKDSEGTFQIQEAVGISYDITTNALVRSGDVITSSVQGQDLASIESIHEAELPVKFQIANVSGANQRTKGSVLMSGSVIVSSLSINAANRQNATYDVTLTGYGDYTVGA
jgi:predicted secreted protein